MLEYRVYFLNDEGHIRAREEFTASDDGEALRIATGLSDAYSDVHRHFTLWSGSREVWDTTKRAFVSEVRARTTDLALPTQKRVFEMQEATLNNHWATSRSKTLLGEHDKLRAAEERHHQGGDDEGA